MIHLAGTLEAHKCLENAMDSSDAEAFQWNL